MDYQLEDQVEEESASFDQNRETFDELAMHYLLWAEESYLRLLTNIELGDTSVSS